MSTSLQIIAAITAIAALSQLTAAVPRCGVNEQWRNCSSCEGNCTNKNPICTKECKPPKCQCIAGYVRNAKGRCIKASSCPCGRNEKYYTCGGCEPYCGQPKPRPCTLQCRIGCQCKPGWVRDRLSGRCIRSQQCPLSSSG